MNAARDPALEVPPAAAAGPVAARLRDLAFALALALTAALVLGSFVGLGIDGYQRAQFADVFEGTAHRPFAYRALAPGLMRGVRWLIPDTAEDAANRWFAANNRRWPLLGKLNRKVELWKNRFSDFAIAAGVLYLSILGFAWALRRLAVTFYRADPGFLHLLTLVAVAGIPAFFRYYSYLYDLPHLFLFTTGLWLIAARRRRAYLLVFALTCLSKETALLLVLVDGLAGPGELSRRAWRGWLGVQLALFALLKLALAVAFRDNPGGFVELHLEHNLFLPPFTAADIVALVALATAVAWDWSRKPPLLRAALWMLVPLLGLGVLWGYLDEYRIYYEVYPVLLLLSAHTVAGVLAEPARDGAPRRPALFAPLADPSP